MKLSLLAIYPLIYIIAVYHYPVTCPIKLERTYSSNQENSISQTVISFCDGMIHNRIHPLTWKELWNINNYSYSLFYSPFWGYLIEKEIILIYITVYIVLAPIFLFHLILIDQSYKKSSKRSI